MDLTKLKNNNLLKVGAATILSVGILGACGNDDPVIDENDDVDVEQPADVTPDDDGDMDEPEIDMEPESDMDTDTKLDKEND